MAHSSSTRAKRTTRACGRDASSRGRRLLLLHELQQSRVDRVRHVDLVAVVDGDHVRFAKLAGTLSWFAERGEDPAVQIKLDELTCEAVDHVDVLTSDVEAARQPLVFDFPDERPVLLEDLDPLILSIRNPQEPLGVDVDAMRDLELIGGDDFDLMGSADLKRKIDDSSSAGPAPKRSKTADPEQL